MLPTLPTQHFRHHWERFDYYHPSFGPASASSSPPPPPPPPVGPAAAGSAPAAAATAIHPLHPPLGSAAGEPQAQYWRSYHRGFGRCGRHWRGPSRLVWFGIGSLVTLAIVRHKAAGSTGTDGSSIAAWPLHDSRPPFFRQHSDHSWQQTPPSAHAAAAAVPAVTTFPMPAAVAAPSPSPPAPQAEVGDSATARRCNRWPADEATPERPWSRWHSRHRPLKEEQSQPTASKSASPTPSTTSPADVDDKARELAVELMIRSLRDLQASNHQPSRRSPAFQPEV